MLKVVYSLNVEDTFEVAKKIVEENSIGNVFAYNTSFNFTIIAPLSARNMNIHQIVEWEYVQKIFLQNGFSVLSSFK